MDTKTIVILLVLIVLALVVVGLVVGAQRRRRNRLQERFGPEYDRAVDEHGNKRAADRKLGEVAERREKLEVRDLDPAERRRYATQWASVQEAFVDAPDAAVRDADRLVGMVMRDRGYPVDDFDTKADMVAADHPHVAANYRAAHVIAERSTTGDGGSTEQLRQAFVHYRALFEELLAEGGEVDLTDRDRSPQGRDGR